ncbi:MAG TPA: NAD-dependent epimerase/dehydratase family protein [Fimbriimonadaceae bacterium]|nr:NAD-dependent epimerase/dehydratase family protein [Fimbriimonadaceae bacterium]
MKVLVTGGAGFIGSHLVHGLVDEGHAVCILDDFSSGSPANLADVAGRVEVIEGSILDQDLFLAASRGCEVIFHLAAIASVPESVERPHETHRVNCEGTIRALEVARQIGARVILSSSSSIYGEGPARPKREDDPVHPASPYAVQKLSAEGYLRVYHDLHGVEGFALRYFNVYGPRQSADNAYAGVIARFFENALQGRSVVIFGDGLQTRDFVFVDDAVRANLLAMSAPGANGEAVNVGSGVATTLNVLASTVFRVCGRDAQVEYREARPGDIRNSCAETTLARDRLGFTAGTRLEEGLRQTERTLV